jgi:serine/threonine protein phosphatase PrpC
MEIIPGRFPNPIIPSPPVRPKQVEEISHLPGNAKNILIWTDQPPLTTIETNKRKHLENYLVQTHSYELGEKATIETSYGTSAGLKRKDKNEDSLGEKFIKFVNGKKVLLFFVSDGMGGHNKGEEASQIGIDHTISSFVNQAQGVIPWKETTTSQLWQQAIQSANLFIVQKNKQSSGDMGATFNGSAAEEVTLPNGQKKLIAYIANVGDSRTYKYSSGNHQLERITQDNSIVEQLVKAGIITDEDRYTHPKRSHIYRSLGEKENVEIDVYPVEIKPGDILVTCSDGLWEMVRDSEIKNIIEQHADNPQALTQSLLTAALERGGEDNVSVGILKSVTRKKVSLLAIPAQKLSPLDRILKEQLGLQETLKAGDIVRTPISTSQGEIIDQTGWKIQHIDQQAKKITIVNIKNSDTKDFSEKEFEKLTKLNPVTIDDVDPMTPDPLGTLKYAITRLPEQGIRGTSGIFYSTSDLLQRVDEIGRNKNLISGITENGGLRQKLSEIQNRLHELQIGDPVLINLPTTVNGKTTESGWTIREIDSPKENIVTVEKDSQTRQVIKENILKTPRSISEIDPNSRNAVDQLRFILLHWIGGGLQTDKNFYPNITLTKLVGLTLKNPEHLHLVITSAKLQEKLKAIIKSRQSR